MKRILTIITAVICIVSTLTVSLYASSPSFKTNGEESSWLGSTINCVKAKKYDEIAPSSILSKSYWNNLQYTSNNSKSSRCSYIDSTNYYSMKSKINESYKVNTSVDGIELYGFTFGADSKYSIAAGIESEKYASCSFVEFIGEVDYETLYIENIYSKMDEFAQNLSYDFINELVKVKNGQLSYDKFFETNGTHIICNYTLGDRYYCDSYVFTNEVELSETFSAELYNKMKGTYDSINGTNENIASLMENYNLTTNRTRKSASCYDLAGIVEPITGFDSIESSIRNWASNVTSENADKRYSTIVEYGQNGLIPIWECLPCDAPISSNELKNAFIDYAKANGLEYSDVTSTYQFSKIKHSDVGIRSGEKTITDCDRFSNQIDYFEIDQKYGDALFRSKYDKVEFEFSFYCKKKSKGTRYLYLYKASDAYKGSNRHSDYLDYTTNIECSKTYGALTKVKLSVYISSLDNYKFALVWRASGTSSDTWYNKDVKVTYTICKK